MTLDQFWSMIEKIHCESGIDIDKRFELFETALEQLPLAEVQSFDAHFTACSHRAFAWGLWGAAYVIGGGCGDDGFWDFRSTLITCGRAIFERALKHPDSLADLPFELGDSLQTEGFQNIAWKVADRLGGDLADCSEPHPKEPSGKQWNDAQLSELYPQLTKKYSNEREDRL
jgi:hypothetical protein